MSVKLTDTVETSATHGKVVDSKGVMQDSFADLIAEIGKGGITQYQINKAIEEFIKNPPSGLSETESAILKLLTTSTISNGSATSTEDSVTVTLEKDDYTDPTSPSGSNVNIEMPIVSSTNAGVATAEQYKLFLDGAHVYEVEAELTGITVQQSSPATGTISGYYIATTSGNLPVTMVVAKVGNLYYNADLVRHLSDSAFAKTIDLSDNNFYFVKNITTLYYYKNSTFYKLYPNTTNLSDASYTIVSQDEYDALTTKDSKTIYFING